MGKKDFRQREQKKPKKGEKKITPIISFEQPAPVEVIKRGKKTPPEEE
jgi:hypothetical protein